MLKNALGTTSESWRLLSRRNQFLISAVALFAISLFACRALTLQDGMPIFGDWVPVDWPYLDRLLNVWDVFAHNGTLVLDQRMVPWLAPLALASGNIGSARFEIIQRIFVAAVIIAPVAISMAFLWNRARNVFVLGVFALYAAFNPWTASRIASGHLPFLLGCWLAVPIYVLATKKLSLRRGLYAGALIALGAAFDLHSAAFLAFIWFICIAVRNRISTKNFLLVACAVFAAAILSAYWVMPILATRSWVASHHALAQSDAMKTTLSLAQNGDFLHVLGNRSYWWSPYSDDFYRGWIGLPSAGLCLLPIAFAVMAARKFRCDYHARIAAILIASGWIPMLIAHFQPAVFTALMGVPGMAFFRDPNKLVFLSVFGILPLIDRRRVSYWALSLSAVTIAFSLMPWISGDLDGAIRPVHVNDGLLAANRWLSENTTVPTDHVLWLPIDVYQKYPWAPTTVNDPVRFWTKVRTIGPYFDPGYDFDQALSSGVVDLQQDMPSFAPSQIHSLLAHEAIRYVVVRLDVPPFGVMHNDVQALDRAPGLQRVAAFGKIEIFKVLGSIRGDFTKTTEARIVAHGWNPIADSEIADPTLAAAYLDANDKSAWSFAHETPRVPVLLENMWDVLMAELGPTPMPVSSRDTYDAPDEGTGIKLNATENLTNSFGGVTAYRVLGLNGDANLRCNGQKSRALLVYQQPENRPRWIAADCPSGATLSIGNGSGVWVFSSLHVSRRAFDDAQALISNLLERPGSGYVLTDTQFVRTAINKWQSRPENPIALPKGDYLIKFGCSRLCSGQFALYRDDNNRIPECRVNASLIKPHCGLGGGRYFATFYAARHVPNILISTADRYLGAAPAIGTALKPDKVYDLPASTFIEISEAPPPVTVRTSTSIPAVISADRLGSAYFANEQPSHVDFNGLKVWSSIGTVITLASLIATLGALLNRRKARNSSARIELASK